MTGIRVHMGYYGGCQVDIAKADEAARGEEALSLATALKAAGELLPEDDLPDEPVVKEEAPSGAVTVEGITEKLHELTLLQLNELLAITNQEILSR